MAQTKKEDVRNAILRAAFERFSEAGYSETSIPAIARASGISTANVYRYFPSKLAILYTLYEPWLVTRLDRLDARLARIADPKRRLECLLLALWRELPRAEGGFANNVMQALSTSGQSGEYDPRLRRLFQERVAAWVARVMALPLRQARLVAGVVLMAFDGFSMNARVPDGIACDAATARLLAAMMLGLPAGQPRPPRIPGP